MWRGLAVAAIERGNLTMQGPLRFVQGFDGILLRVPIFLEAAGPAETWGCAGAARARARQGGC